MVTTLAAIVALSLCAEANQPSVAAIVGQPAPEFALSDLDGKEVKLSDHLGQTIILEWFNPGCPYVRYAHDDGPLRTQAADATTDATVWLAINSSAPGKQGHGIEANREAAKAWKMDHPILVDEDGTVGHKYGARTTPQMFIIDAKGLLVYAGALDNSPLGKAQGDPTNYVSAALAQVGSEAGVKVDNTKPYGCSVKY